MKHACTVGTVGTVGTVVTVVTVGTVGLLGNGSSAFALPSRSSSH